MTSRDRHTQCGPLGPRRKRTLEVESDSEIDFSHPGDGRRFSEERRRQRATVPDVVALVREVLDVHEQLKSITGSSRIERAHLRRAAAAKNADDWRLPGRPPERKHISK